MLKTYGAAPYGAAIKKLEQQIKERQQSVDEKIGVKVRWQYTLLQKPDVELTGWFRNQIPVSHHHIFGTYQPIASECRKSNRFR